MSGHREEADRRRAWVQNYPVNRHHLRTRGFVDTGGVLLRGRVRVRVDMGACLWFVTDPDGVDVGVASTPLAALGYALDATRETGNPFWREIDAALRLKPATWSSGA